MSIKFYCESKLNDWQTEREKKKQIFSGVFLKILGEVLTVEEQF